jgi:hypothetical protein
MTTGTFEPFEVDGILFNTKLEWREYNDNIAFLDYALSQALRPPAKTGWQRREELHNSLKERNDPEFFVIKKYYSQVKSGAKQRNIPFIISKEEMVEVFVKSNRRCAISGMSLNFYPSANNLASLDRIDPFGPYSVENVQVVTADINVMKSSFGGDAFSALCKMIALNMYVTGK